MSADLGHKYLSPDATGVDVSRVTDRDEMSLLDLLTPILRNRFLVLRTMGAACIIVLGIGLLQPAHYTATASFMPQSRRPPLSLSGLAAQFGLAIPAEEASQSPVFYADLLKSREILGAVVETRYTPMSDTGPINGTLVNLFRSRGRGENERREAAIKRLRKMMTVTAVQRTGIVELSVEARYATLAEQITQRLLDELNSFNLNTRQSRARAEREFTEKRLEEVKGELRGAEDRLQTFLQRNRDYRNSPYLMFQEDRLARDVSMRQQLYTTLVQAYEQAKIDEVRDTPVITVIERPQAPARPDSRRLLLKGLLALMVGGVLGVSMSIGGQFLRRAAPGSPEVAEFSALKKETFDDLRHPLRAARRVLLGGEQDRREDL